MSVARITDHSAQAANRVLSQSRKPRFLALLNAMTSQVQVAEDALYPLQESRFFGKASGADLDGIGQLVGQSRAGQNDAVYRLFLQARIFASATDATTPTVTRIVQTLFDAKSVQVISQMSAGFARRQAPAVLGLEIGSPALDRSLWQQAIALIRDSLAAAVSISFVSVFDADASFALAGPVDGQGLGGAAITGGMAELIFQDQGA